MGGAQKQAAAVLPCLCLPPARQAAAHLPSQPPAEWHSSVIGAPSVARLAASTAVATRSRYQSTGGVGGWEATGRLVGSRQRAGALCTCSQQPAQQAAASHIRGRTRGPRRQSALPVGGIAQACGVASPAVEGGLQLFNSPRRARTPQPTTCPLPSSPPLLTSRCAPLGPPPHAAPAPPAAPPAPCNLWSCCPGPAGAPRCGSPCPLARRRRLQ